MKLISQGAQYAISAVIALSKQPKGTTVSAAALAEPLNCPPAYLSQLLSKLKPSGILKSQRGLNGGVYLARDPAEIALIEVIEAIDGMDFFENCFLGIEGCGRIEPCPFHDFWSNERKKIQDWLTKTTFHECEQRMSQAWFDLRLQYSS
ncbi:Rrf2 family transcriptional regulator [Aliifodinibius sp. S!AR15-10]|uniref:RrF2 family transcriptional regulator n=1 Tax=Aliifodinibius sp. S!AR15-10 TaxID=2950437 RepID=UPI0028569255|nr:Rrf2 family transcriptional regulator [Aliifodinibius sp. S!AR15-10]MDR8393419.1 Rrf2 family transcriptional regulator [Aliifodinibius sp. S!AR15-10]